MRASRKNKLRKKRNRALKKAPPLKQSRPTKAMSINHETYDDAYLNQILTDVQTIALVGASNKTERPSNEVLKYLIDKGYRVFPINPGLAGQEIAGQKVYANITDIDHPIDMIDIFRKSEAVEAIVDEALELKPQPKVIWMQLDVRDEKSAKKAEAQGIKVVMNKCPKIEYERLGLGLTAADL